MAAAQPFIYSSGVDNAGAVLPGGSTDPHWTFVKAAPTSTSGNAFVLTSAGLFPGGGGFAAYVPNTADAKWISTTPVAFTGLGNVQYTQTFDLSSYVLPTVTISGQFGIADGFLGLFVNGTRVTTGTGGLPNETSATHPWTDLRSFTVPLALLNAGVNTIEFDASVENADYNGLFVDLTGAGQLAATPAPEPATLALLAGGLGLVGLAARRRRA